MQNLLVVIITFMVLTGCGHHEGHHHHSGQGGHKVELDDGKKWIANPETTQGVKNMQLLVEEASGTVDRELVTGLQEEFKMIFKNCTMTGEAHEQLHNYLLPMKELFDGLKSEEEGVKKRSLEELEQHLGAYSNYFQ